MLIYLKNTCNIKILLMLFLVLVLTLPLTSGCTDSNQKPEDTGSTITEDINTSESSKKTSIDDTMTTTQANDEGTTTETAKETEPSEQVEIKTKPISELNIGDKLVEPSWEWAFKSKDNYSGDPLFKSIEWIIVDQDHYQEQGLDPHFTLLSLECIANHEYNDTNDNYWGNSTLRTFLHDVFLTSIPSDFRSQIILTPTANWDADSQEYYTSDDYVYIPSKDELGAHYAASMPLGSAFSYFDFENSQWGPQNEEELEIRRVSSFPGMREEVILSMSCRSIRAENTMSTSYFDSRGKVKPYEYVVGSSFIRVIINVSLDMMVTENTNEHGFYEVVWQD